jgi:PilZ domain
MSGDKISIGFTSAKYQAKEDCMLKDRRLFARKPVILEIEQEGHSIGKIYRLRNISQSGFSLETGHCMAEGESFDLSFSLPESQDIISLCGKVIWIKKISANPENYYIGFGYLANPDKAPVLFPLLLNKLRQAECHKIHLSACSKS